MFPCFTCGQLAFTIRGCCDVCDPARHRQRHEQLAAYDTARAAYLHETGREPLADWYAFEAWSRRKNEAL
jgi:hypothetical protein